MPETLEKLNISKKFHPFLENLSENADKKDRLPFIGRENEIETVMETLMRRLKHNLLLIGKSGVGKTALITEVASRINLKQVPPPLQGKVILEFSLNRFFYSRDSQEVLLKDLEQFFSELIKIKDTVILFLDEMQLQSLPDADKKDRQEQVQSVLKAYVAQRELSIIAATTPENYFKSIKSDEILSFNFCPLSLEEPDRKEMLEILKGVTPYFEEYYSLRIPAELFEQIIILLDNFSPHRAFPHKAIDLVDMCCSRTSLKNGEELDLEIIYQSIADLSRLPVDIVKIDPAEHRMNIRGYLEKEVVNQRAAIEEISRIIKLSGLEGETHRSHPEGVFLFLGTAGVGKSYVARKIAQYLFGSPEKLRVIDLQDYTEPEDFKKLISDDKADPGILVREVDDHPFSVILFENIGNVNEDVLDDLGNALAKGTIVDAAGKKHFIANIIFILSLTSIGEEKIESPIGFVKGNQIRYELVIPPKINNVLDSVDEIIQFEALTEEHLKLIASDKMEDVKEEIKKKYNSDVLVGEGVFKSISKESLQEGGFAHTVAEKIERQIKLKLLDLITKTEKQQTFEISMKNNSIRIKKK
jgi:ATP-dependent Clp protease ATP-binding subunit ClpA